MKLGCHVSIRNGYYGAARTAHSIGAKSYQYFPKNPRALGVKNYDRQDAERCAEFCGNQQISSIGHTAYPVNIAIQDSGVRKAIAAALLNDLDIAERCGSVGVVVHFGKYKGDEPLEGYRLILEMLNRVLSAWNGRALLLLENQAAEMGMTLEELVQIRSLAERPEAIGFCFDTCHAFASGLWTDGNLAELVLKGEELGYLKQLKAVHLNDSLYPGGSFRDRHAMIGHGEIGERRIKQFLESKFIYDDLPVVLETPTPAGSSHQEEIKAVGRLISND